MSIAPKNAPAQTSTNSRTDGEKTFSRRDILAAGATGFAALALSSVANAQTGQPASAVAGRANRNGRFAGKVVLITGATSGIGEATAKAFAQQGAKVMFCGRRENLGRQVQQGIRDMGGEATYQKADVRQEAEVAALVKACVAKYGRIDVAFNNAGIEAPPKTMADLTPEEYQNVIATNQFGVFYAMRHELPVMLRQKGGAIINTASVGGHRGFAMIGPYGASKAAVLQMTRVAALENADKNIRINSISPGAVDTPMLRRALASWGTDPQVVADGYPIKRLATSDEMARSVLYLASDEASIVTGTDMDLTGGYLTR